jgi:hypothetical protein
MIFYDKLSSYTELMRLAKISENWRMHIRLQTSHKFEYKKKIRQRALKKSRSFDAVQFLRIRRECNYFFTKRNTNENTFRSLV